MSAAPARRYEKTFSEIIKEKLDGAIHRVDFTDEEEPIQRRHEIYNFSPAMILRTTSNIPIFMIQMFNFSAEDDKFTVEPDKIIHQDHAMYENWRAVMGDDAPEPLTWNDHVVTETADGVIATTKGPSRVYRLKLRNLWVDGGVVVNLFASSGGITPDGSKLPMNKVNVMGAYTTMNFDFKLDAAEEFLEFAIAPHIAHEVRETWKGASWSVGDAVQITHTNRDKRKALYVSKMLKGDFNKVERKQSKAERKSTNKPKYKGEKPAAYVLEDVTTECNASVKTRTSMVLTDYSNATVVKLQFLPTA